MNFLDKLDFLMRGKEIGKSTLARESGVPYTTIDSFYKKGYENVKLSTLKKLSAYFLVPLDYWADDDSWIEQEKPVTISDDGLSPKKRALIESIKNLDDSDLDVIQAAADALIARRGQ